MLIDVEFPAPDSLLADQDSMTDQVKEILEAFFRERILGVSIPSQDILAFLLIPWPVFFQEMHPATEAPPHPWDWLRPEEDGTIRMPLGDNLIVARWHQVQSAIEAKLLCTHPAPDAKQSCGKPATSFVKSTDSATGAKSTKPRCGDHEGLLDDGTEGEVVLARRLPIRTS